VSPDTGRKYSFFTFTALYGLWLTLGGVRGADHPTPLSEGGGKK
jgi:hypothetical protein